MAGKPTNRIGERANGLACQGLSLRVFQPASCNGAGDRIGIKPPARPRRRPKSAAVPAQTVGLSISSHISTSIASNSSAMASGLRP